VGVGDATGDADGATETDGPALGGRVPLNVGTTSGGAEGSVGCGT
jgi:hypothetical protein